MKEKKYDKKTDRHEKLRQNVNFISEDQTFMKAINAKRASVIRTGFGNIDNILGGGLTNTLYVLGSETSTGKTAIMTTFAKNAAEQDVDVFYFALEMNKIELYARGIAAESYKNSLKDKNAIHTPLKTSFSRKLTIPSMKYTTNLISRSIKPSVSSIKTLLEALEGILHKMSTIP